MRIPQILVAAFICLVATSVLAQESFPVNGVHDFREGFHAFTGATIFTANGDTLDSAVLVIRDGKVLSVSKSKPPAGTVVHSCKGRFIYPSFIDPCAVLEKPSKKKPGSEPKAPSDFDPPKGKPSNWNPAIHPEYEHVQEIPLNRKVEEDWLKAGFGIVNLHKPDGIMRGRSSIVFLGVSEPNLALITTPQPVNHFSFSKGSSTFDYPSSHMGAIALLRQTFYDAQWYQRTGHLEETNPSLSALKSIQQEVNIFEAGNSLSIRNIQSLQDEFGLSFVIRGVGKEYLVRKEIPAKSKLVLPLSFPKAMDVSDPYDARMVSLEELKHWEAAPYNIRFMAEHGHSVALTRDTLKSHKEFLAAIRTVHGTGVSHGMLLQMLTLNPAQMLKIHPEAGSLKPGSFADFFISNAPITDPEFKIHEHWVKGACAFKEQYVPNTLEGTYNLVVEKTDFRVRIDRSDDSGVKARVEGDSLHSATVSVDGALISVVIRSKKDQTPLYRLSGKLNFGGDVWDGRGQNQRGDWVSWGAIKDRKSTTGKIREAHDTLRKPLPSILHPNMAYGWDSLKREGSYVLTNATVWTCADTGRLERADVWVENGKIKEVGSGKLYPESLKRINLSGMHITPGLIDEHSHIAIRGGVNEWAQSSSAEVRIEDAINPWNIHIYRQLAGGVTAAQLLHGSANPIGGQSALIKLRWGETGNGMLIKGADGFIKFALGENVKRSNTNKNKGRFPLTRMGVEQSFVDAFERAKHYGEHKTVPASSKKKSPQPASTQRVDLELEALVQILNDQRFITCHSYVQSEILMLMAVADSFDFRVNTFTHILEGYKIAPQLAEHGAHASTFSDWWAYKFEVNDAIPYNAALLTRCGVNVAINSDDAEMGRRLNQEAAKLVKYGGLSEVEALNTVTINPAKMLHLDQRMGSVEAGKDADLVVWSDHPLSVYSKVEQTYIDGIRYYDRNKVEQTEAAIEAERTRLIHAMMAAKDSAKKKPAQKKTPEYHCDTELEDYTTE